MGSKKRILISIAVGAGLSLLFGPGFVRWLELRAQQTQLEGEVVALRQENQQLYEQTRRLREDPSYMETVARRELGFVRPGETVIKIRSSREE